MLVTRRTFVAICFDAVIFIQQFGTLDLLAQNEARVAGVGHLHAAQHLTHDDFDVLVVDAHAL